MNLYHGIFIFLSLLLSLMLSSTITAVESNPYRVDNFRGLNNTDAWWPHISGNGELIVFLTNIIVDEDSDAIWVANADGTERQMIYYNSSIDDSFTGPKFSPNGDKIVFVQRGKPKGFFLQVLEKNGTKWNESATISTTYTTERFGLRQPSFAPNTTLFVVYNIDKFPCF